MQACELLMLRLVHVHVGFPQSGHQLLKVHQQLVHIVALATSLAYCLALRALALRGDVHAPATATGVPPYGTCRVRRAVLCVHERTQHLHSARLL